MMASKTAAYICVLTVLVNIAGCSSIEEQEVINQQYVDSDEYESFSQQADSEQDRAQGGIEAQLEKLIACSSARELTVPFKVDSTTIAQWEGAGQNHCEEDHPVNELPYTLEVIGTTSVQGLEAKWILRSRKSMYQHQDLLVATYKDQELKNVEAIAHYRRNLGENITTHVQVSTKEDQLAITKVEHRHIKYPIEQNNSVETIYHIDSDGVISYL